MKKIFIVLVLFVTPILTKILLNYFGFNHIYLISACLISLSNILLNKINIGDESDKKKYIRKSCKILCSLSKDSKNQTDVVSKYALNKVK